MNIFQKTLDGLEADEKIILWIEKHWILRIGILFIFLFVTIVPGILGYALISWTLNSSTDILLGMSFLFLYELFAILYSFIMLLNEELDIFIVTNKRVIDIDQLHFIERRVSDLSINNIQDITYETKGLLGTLFHYGTIIVKTGAGRASEILIKYVPNAFDTVKILLDLVHAAHSDKNSSSAKL